MFLIKAFMRRDGMEVKLAFAHYQGMTVMMRIGPGRRAHSGQGGGGAYTGSPGGLLQPV